LFLQPKKIGVYHTWRRDVEDGCLLAVKVRHRSCALIFYVDGFAKNSSGEGTTMANIIARLADGVGKGLVAGLAGTAAMTFSSTVEMKLRGRSASKAPAQAICKSLGLETVSEEAQTRLNNLVHWGYGTAWGAVRGLLEVSGVHGMAATVVHFGLVWATEQIMLPRTGVAPPITEQPINEIAVDAWHHLVYAEATGLTYAGLFSEDSQARMARG
jgi:hypothetical protein